MYFHYHLISNSFYLKSFSQTICAYMHPGQIYVFVEVSCHGISILFKFFFSFLHQVGLKPIIRYEFLESFWAQKIDAFIYFYLFFKSKFEVNKALRSISIEIVFFKRFSANSDWPMTFFTSFYESSFIKFHS